MSPLLPDGRDLVAGSGGGALGGRGTTVATELGRVAGGDGVVVRPLPLDHILGVGGREALVARAGELEEIPSRVT